MRKILIGALSVAGLLATVLALASSPAASQMVVAFQTDTQPGEYTVSWGTQGGCDPSKPSADTTLATSGAEGSISRSVSAPARTPGAASVRDATPTAGSAVEFSVAVAAHCTYNWKVAFTSSLGGSNGINCAVGYTIGGESPVTGSRDGILDFVEVPGTFADEIVLSVEAGADAVCNSLGKIAVDIPRPTTSADKPSQPHSGAILNTVFTVTATAVKDSNDECATVSGETEVNDQDTLDGADATDDDTVGVTLTVVDEPLSVQGANCDYNVAVDVPPGFTPTVRGADSGKVVNYATTPATKDVADNGSIVDGGRDDDAIPDTLDTSVADCGQEVVEDGVDEALGTDDDIKSTVTGEPCVSLRVAVAVRDIYILQRVSGDSAGGNGRYELSEDSACSIPGDLPPGLDQRTTGGIMVIKGSTVVELREGFFNITGAVLSPVDPIPGFDPAQRFALNDEADECVMSTKVKGMPDHCTAGATPISVNMVTGVDDRGRAIMTFDITCEVATDDGGDMDGGDMDGGDMDGGDDVDEPEGPMADTPTG